jgi:oxazoline/thiazoline synthase
MGKLQFRPDLRVVKCNDDGVFLLSGRGCYFLSGRVFKELVPFLCGRLTERQIVKCLEGKLSHLEICYALALLKSDSYVIETNSNADSASGFNSLEVYSGFANRKLRRASVSLHTFGQIQYKELAMPFRSSHIQMSNSGFPVVATDDYLDSGLKDWNKSMLQKGKAWMLFKPTGNVIWLGPIFRPENTACWSCLKERLNQNNIKQKRSNISEMPVSQETITKVAANMAVIEVLRWFEEGKNERIEGAIVTLDLGRVEIRTHYVTRHPQCKNCGEFNSGAKGRNIPIILKSSPIGSSENGLCRSATAEQIIMKLLPHFSPITGVISEVNRITDLEYPVPLYHSRQGGAKNHAKNKGLDLLNDACGKGKTDYEAKASAMCEAIESYSCNFAGDEVRLRAKFSDLKGNAIHPHSLLLFSKRQYNTRVDHCADVSPIHFIPKPFDPRRNIDWSPIWSLTHSVFKYVPTAYCYYDYPQNKKSTFCLADSNGNAAGNTIEEAILHGFLELVERDGVSIWWYNRLERPAVDLSSFDEPYFEKLRYFYETNHRKLWVLDLTTDLNIPIFAAISSRTNARTEEIAFGFGAHFDPKIAVTHALTEMAQLIPHSEVENAHCISDQVSSDLMNWWCTATLKQHFYLLPDSSQKLKTNFDYTIHKFTDIRDYVIQSVSIGESLGLEILVLNQTRSDVGMPVVKVIVPGLRHFWARFAPGRLYDVPVDLGWLKKKRQESELNKTHLFV